MPVFNPPLSSAAWDQYVRLKAELCTPADIKRWLAEVERARAEKAGKKGKR